MSIELDHIVIGAATLEDGVRFVKQRLGVDIPAGGKHPLMSTHNHLMRLGASSFLEVIAIDPDAPPPERPRWFGLDDPALQARLRESPRLIGWVARTDDIDAAVAASPVPFGDPIPVTRGTLSWRLTVAADGRPPMDGIAPMLIQWDDGLRPWEAMADRGCQLEILMLAHPSTQKLQNTLRAIGLDQPEYLHVQEAAVPILTASIQTPTGLVTL
jgi:hypothetical protein